MINRMINWTFGSFFRTLGRFLFYILVATLVYFCISGFPKVDAKTIDANKYSRFGISSSNMTTLPVMFTVSANSYTRIYSDIYYENYVTYESYDYVMLEMCHTGSNTFSIYTNNSYYKDFKLVETTNACTINSYSGYIGYYFFSIATYDNNPEGVFSSNSSFIMSSTATSARQFSINKVYVSDEDLYLTYKNSANQAEFENKLNDLEEQMKKNQQLLDDKLNTVQSEIKKQQEQNNQKFNEMQSQMQQNQQQTNQKFEELEENQNKNTQDMIDNQNKNNQELMDNQNKNNEELKDKLDEEFKTCRPSKNLLDTSKFQEKMANGMKATLNEDGSIRFNGTTTAQTNFWISNYNQQLTKGKYTFSTSVNLTSKGKYTFNGTTNGENITIANGKTNITFTINENLVITNILIQIDAGVTFNNEDFYLMLEEGTNASPYEPYGEEICTNKMDETNNKLDDLNDNLTSTDTSSAENQASGFFSDFDSGDYGLSDVITMPLQLIKNITSTTCSPLSIPIPFVDTNVILPCMNTIYSEFFGNILTIYQTITTGIIAYWVCINIFAMVKGFKDPDSDNIEVMEL